MNKSKLICIFSQSLMLGGSEKQSVLLAKELNKFFRINFIIFYPEKIKNSLLDQLIDSNIELLLENKLSQSEKKVLRHKN